MNIFYLDEDPKICALSIIAINMFVKMIIEYAQLIINSSSSIRWLRRLWS
jgi:hypothetical protein